MRILIQTAIFCFFKACYTHVTPMLRQTTYVTLTHVKKKKMPAHRRAHPQLEGKQPQRTCIICWAPFPQDLLSQNKISESWLHTKSLMSHSSIETENKASLGVINWSHHSNGIFLSNRWQSRQPLPVKKWIDLTTSCKSRVKTGEQHLICVAFERSIQTKCI